MYKIFGLLWMYHIPVLILMPWIVLFYTVHRMSDPAAEVTVINYTVLLPGSRRDRPDTIHLGIILNEQTASIRSINLLKSILYHQGRLSQSMEICRNPMEQSGFQNCSPIFFPRTSPLHLHIFADNTTGILVQNYLRKVNLYHIQCSYYNAEPYLNVIKNSSYSQTFDQYEFLKVFWPEIIPKHVDKLITLDPNTLINYNIAELWDHFDKFMFTQALGMVFESSNEVNDRPSQRGRPLGSSYMPDSAVVLWYLSRLRAIGWQALATAKVNAVVEKIKHGESSLGTFNEVVLMKRTLLYPLPCEWNLALWNSNTTYACPVVWPSARPDRVDCVSVGHKMGTRTKPNVVRLVHYRDTPDNKEFNNSKLITAALDRTNTSLTMKELRQRFLDISRTFQALAIECFGTRYGYRRPSEE